MTWLIFCEMIFLILIFHGSIQQSQLPRARYGQARLSPSPLAGFRHVLARAGNLDFPDKSALVRIS
jgi:hypothetical protein